MANIIYTRWQLFVYNGSCNWNSPIRAMLEDSSSTYSPSRAHASLQDVINAGFVELSGSGYSRAFVTGKILQEDNTQHLVRFLCDNVNFGAIEPNKTVKGVLFYVRMGANDNPSVDIPMVYIDTATGLPAVTTGGQFILSIPTTGLIIAKMQTP